MIPRDPEAYNDQAGDRQQARDRGEIGDSEPVGTRGAGGVTEGRDRAIDADAAHTLEHGGYGGEQEYADSATDMKLAGSAAGAVDGEYVNQTDMTDQTGDRSRSQADEESRQGGQRRIDDTGITTDTRQSGL